MNQILKTQISWRFTALEITNSGGLIFVNIWETSNNEYCGLTNADVKMLTGFLTTSFICNEDGL